MDDIKIILRKIYPEVSSLDEIKITEIGTGHGETLP